jgi:HK97 gp10 family phage protein
MNADIKLDGYDEVIVALNSLVDEAKIQAALGRACALVERSAKIKAPKGNGELRRSITSKVEGLEGVVYTPLEYAPYVEFGTGIHAEGGKGRQDVPWVYCDEKGEFHTTEGQHPQPFLRPALQQNRKKIVKIIKENIGND